MTALQAAFYVRNTAQGMKGGREKGVGGGFKLKVEGLNWQPGQCNIEKESPGSCWIVELSATGAETDIRLGGLDL